MVKAFPTAYGFGADTRGAYGSGTPPVALFVTNLNDSGAGSLRAAAIDTRPRVIIFRIGGTIDCQTTIAVTSPYAYFAGQTAPGGGICLRNAGTNKLGPMRIEASDIIVRFMKFRGGFVSIPSNQNHSIDFRNLTASNAIEHCVIDHCSISWGTDMNIMTGAGTNYITVQKCLISECLRNASSQGVHNRGLNHRYSGQGTPNHHFTDWANVFSQHEYRTPQLADVTQTEVINNIVYHNDSFGMNINADAHGNVVAMTARYEGNYFKRNTGANQHREHQLSTGYGPDTKIYLKGTVGFTRLTETASEQDANGFPVYVDETDKALKRGDNASVWTQTDRSVVADSANPPTRVTATQALTSLVTNYSTAPDVGAYRTCNSSGVGINNPDLTDVRVMNDVKNNTGAYIDREWEVAGSAPAYDARGYPALAAGTAPTDSNNDGIPNGWAGLPGGKTANDTSPTGYSYLENYLNELAGDTLGSSGGTTMVHTVANITRTPKNHTMTRGGLDGILNHTKANRTLTPKTHVMTYTPVPGFYALHATVKNIAWVGGNNTMTVSRVSGTTLAHTIANISRVGGNHTMSRVMPPVTLAHTVANLDRGVGNHTMTYTAATVAPPFNLRFLTSGADTANASSYTTGSMTPTAGSLICVFVDVSDADDPGAFNISSTLTGGTWTSKFNQPWNTLAAPIGRLRCWTGSGFTGTGTITFSGFPDAVTGARWIVCEVNGQDANPIVQAISKSDDTDNLYEVLPFSSYGTTDHVVISVFAKAGTGPLTQSELENWLPLDAEVAHATPDRRLWAQYGFDATSTTATMDWDSTDQVSASGGLEILHNGAVLVFGPTYSLSAPPGRLKSYSAVGTLVEEKRGS